MDQMNAENRDRNRSKDTGQVSHGLNLVLRLTNPVDMPALLLEIRKRKRQVDLALSELNFVHFARFLPTRDGSELLVITEFDGPLEPYTMDFAIAIGDVFTAILRFVADAPPLPVKDHPDEFLEFVKRNNRVEIRGLPPEDDYPVYSAYPKMTVLDIVGPRTQLPPPVADRASADVDLADVQGNILVGYRARFARHFILAVTDAPRARSWFAALARGPQHGVPGVTAAQRWSGPKPATMLSLGFTWSGLVALGLKADLLEHFPQAFRDGPADEQRARANGDVGGAAPEHWRLGGSGNAEHAMLSLYAFGDDSDAFDLASRAIRAAAADTHRQSGIKLLAEHDATALPDGREPFGYRDGIGQPRIADPSGVSRDMQPAASPGEFLLGPHYEDIFGGPSIGKLAPQLATNGTFCAVRLMAQDVDAFNRLLDDASRTLGVSRELVAAKLVGRWFDGEPVALYADDDARSTAPAGARDRNDFDYAPSYEYPDTFHDHAGLRCPIGAHIRRTNPRTSRAAGVRYSRRLIRRGMPYRLSSADGQVTETGMFGLFFCGSLERQFEFIQQQWVEGDLFASGIRRTQDPLGGSQTMSGEFLLPGMGPDRSTATVALPLLVTTRGSLYLFMPGLRALRELDQSLADPETAVAGDEVKAMRAAILSTLPREVIASVAHVRPASGSTAGAAPISPTRLAGFSPDRFDPTDRAFLANPYPTFAAFRQLGPVHYVPRHAAFWVFTYEHVSELLTDEARFLKLPSGATNLRGLFTMDPPRHTLVRRLLNPAFEVAMANCRQVAGDAIDQALDGIGRDCFDLVECFARPVPREVLFEVLGVPSSQRARIDGLARTVLMFSDHTLEPLERLAGKQAGEQLARALADLLPVALSDSRRTLLHEIAVLTRPNRGGELEVSEAVVTLMHFVLGGYLSSEFLLCTGTRNLLLDDRKPWARLQVDPKLWPAAVEEMRRFDAPLGVVDRYAARDTDLGGLPIPSGTRLMGMLGAANHDADVFGPDADIFDIRRPAGPHLALGLGSHECIGKPLQAVVIPLALKKLMEGFPDLRLLSAAQPPWLSNPYFRSFSRLMVSA